MHATIFVLGFGLSLVLGALGLSLICSPKQHAQHQHLRYPVSSKEKRSFLSLSPAVLMSCLLATKLLAAASLECLNDGHVSKKLWPPDIHQHFYSKKSINRLILSEYYSAPCYFSCNKNLCVHPPTSIHFRKDKRIIKFIGMLSRNFRFLPKTKGDTRTFFFRICNWKGLLITNSCCNLRTAHLSN